MSSKYRFDQMDASENVFFSRQLEQIRAEVFNVRYPELLGRSLVPVNNQIDNGAERHTIQIFDRTGNAELSSDYSSRGPRADVKGREESFKIRSILASYGYNLQEVRAAKFAKVDLTGARARAARLNVETKIDETIILGSKLFGLTGLTNATGTQTYDVTSAWSGKTAAEILADLQAAIDKIPNTTNYIYTPNTMAIATTLYSLIKAKPLPDTNGHTVLSYFQMQNPGLQIVPVWRLNNTNPSAKAQIIIYNKNPEYLEAIIPQEFEQLPPQASGLEIITECHARTGGVAVYHPGSMLYMVNMN